MHDQGRIYTISDPANGRSRQSEEKQKRFQKPMPRSVLADKFNPETAIEVIEEEMTEESDEEEDDNGIRVRSYTQF